MSLMARFLPLKLLIFVNMTREIIEASGIKKMLWLHTFVYVKTTSRPFPVTRSKAKYVGACVGVAVGSVELLISSTIFLFGFLGI